MRKSLIFVLVSLALLAVACGSSGAPTDYEDSVEDFYMAGCRVALDDPQFGNVEAVCQCAYDRISAEIPFDDFEGLNNRLREDVSILKNPEQDSVAPAALAIVSDCIKSVPLSS